MANTQINITANGTKTLATAGKYCDRNIDINVDVAGKPTQFTNLYDTANVTLKTRAEGSSSGVTYTADNYTNCIKIPYHHTAGAPVELRLRGIGTVRDRIGCVLLDANEERVQHYQISNTSYFTQSYDEHGDAVITFKSGPQGYAWEYFLFNFQYIGINTNATAKVGPIITINEPIGNGGHV